MASAISYSIGIRMPNIAYHV